MLVVTLSAMEINRRSSKDSKQQESLEPRLKSHLCVVSQQELFLSEESDEIMTRCGFELPWVQLLGQVEEWLRSFLSHHKTTIIL